MIAFAIVLVIIGAVLLAISSPRKGGNIEIGTSDVRTTLPEITGLAKIPAFILGLVFIGLGLWMGVVLFIKSTEQPTPPVPLQPTAILIVATSPPTVVEAESKPTKSQHPELTETPVMPTDISIPATNIPVAKPTDMPEPTNNPTSTHTPSSTPPPHTPKVAEPIFPFKVNGIVATGGKIAVNSGRLEIEIGMISKYGYTNPYLMFDAETLYSGRYFWQTKVSEFEPKFVICLPEPVKGVLSMGNVADLSIPDLREVFPCQ